MATAPVKSQPLHNFSLPTYLRWGGGSSNHHHHHCFRRSAPPGESLPAAEGDSDRNESDPDSRPGHVGSRHGRRFFLGRGSSSDVERKQGRRDVKEENQRISSKNGEGGGMEGGGEAEGEPMEEEAVQRPWNLRPRRANPSPRVAELTEAVAAATLSPTENPPPKSARLRGFGETPAAAGGEKKEKRRLWMALSKEEIEEDFFVMTGSRPARRPKKRPKHVQKLLSTAFPGLWLVGASADDFQVPDESAKK